MTTSYLRDRRFWAGTTERAARMFVGTLLSTLGLPAAGDSIGVDVRAIGWRDALSLAAGAAVASVMFSIVAGKASGPAGSPSLVNDRPGNDPGTAGERRPPTPAR